MAYADEGNSADWHNLWFDAVNVTSVARNGWGYGTCGRCGAKSKFAGRPGTRLKKFKCDACGANNRLDFTFEYWSLN